MAILEQMLPGAQRCQTLLHKSAPLFVCRTVKSMYHWHNPVNCLKPSTCSLLISRKAQQYEAATFSASLQFIFVKNSLEPRTQIQFSIFYWPQNVRILGPFRPIWQPRGCYSGKGRFGPKLRALYRFTFLWIMAFGPVQEIQSGRGRICTLAKAQDETGAVREMNPCRNSQNKITLSRSAGKLPKCDTSYAVCLRRFRWFYVKASWVLKRKMVGVSNFVSTSN